jgi:hypothetical protein
MTVTNRPTGSEKKLFNLNFFGDCVDTGKGDGGSAAQKRRAAPLPDTVRDRKNSYTVIHTLDGNPGTRAPGHRSPGPWSQGIFLFLFLFFFAGVHFFQGLDEVDFFDESLSSLSRLG